MNNILYFLRHFSIAVFVILFAQYCACIRPMKCTQRFEDSQKVTAIVTLNTNNNYLVEFQYTFSSLEYNQRHYSSSESKDETFMTLPPFECHPNNWTSIATHVLSYSPLLTCSARINDELITHTMKPGISISANITPLSNDVVSIKGMLCFSTPSEENNNTKYDNRVFVLNSLIFLGEKTDLFSTSISSD